MFLADVGVDVDVHPRCVHLRCVQRDQVLDAETGVEVIGHVRLGCVDRGTEQAHLGRHPVQGRCDGLASCDPGLVVVRDDQHAGAAELLGVLGSPLAAALTRLGRALVVRRRSHAELFDDAVGALLALDLWSHMPR